MKKNDFRLYNLPLKTINPPPLPTWAILILNETQRTGTKSLVDHLCPLKLPTSSPPDLHALH